MTAPRLPSAAPGPQESIPFDEIHQWYREQLADATERIAFLEITLRKRAQEIAVLRNGGGEGA